MPTQQPLDTLVINKVDTTDTLDAMDAAGLVNENELYLVEEGSEDFLVDAAPTEGSPNLVTSGGVYQAIQEHGGAQSDWNENDVTSKAHILNRPFGYYEAQRVEVKSEQTVTVTNGSSDVSEFYFEPGPDVPCIVVWDGVEYACTGYYGIDGIELGDLETEPFCIVYFPPDDYTILYTNDPDGEFTHTIQIFELEEVPVKISEEWLPGDLGATITIREW